MNGEEEPQQRPFGILDWIAIYLCADMLSAGIVGVFTSVAGAWFPIMLGAITWWLYEGYVQQQIKDGRR